MSKTTILTIIAAACCTAAAVGGNPDVPRCDGDVDRDNRVDINDLNALLGDFGQPGPSDADFTGDGTVDVNDLNVLLSNWNGDCGATIDDVQPRTITAGTVITITGQGFGDDPADLCVMIAPTAGGDELQPLPVLALTATDTTVTAIVDNVQPGFTTGQLIVEVGDGERIQGVEVPDLEQVEDPWVWGTTGNNPVFGPELTVNGAVLSNSTTFYGAWLSGSLSIVVDLPDPCPTGTQFAVWIRGKQDGASFWFDKYSNVGVIPPGGLSAFFCASRICTQIETMLETKFPGTDFGCVLVPLGGSQYQITVVPPISWGSLFDGTWLGNKFEVRIFR